MAESIFATYDRSNNDGELILHRIDIRKKEASARHYPSKLNGVSTIERISTPIGSRRFRWFANCFASRRIEIPESGIRIVPVEGKGLVIVEE